MIEQLDVSLIEQQLEDKADPEVLHEIWQLKEQLGDKLIILGHHYQRDDVIQFADKTGDSFELAKYASQHKGEKYIVFCGVHFMAETADILTSREQTVILPDLQAGCSMADMATIDAVKKAWWQLTNTVKEKIIPVTYMNSTAAIKAFVGKNGGVVCTSSNAEAALNWAFDRGDKVLFIPDQHLGRNTAYQMGISLDNMILWDPEKQNGALGSLAIHNAKMILWKGACSVHQKFYQFHLEQFRDNYPEGKIMVHPECMFEVAQQADIMGSTSKIIKVIEAAEKGSVWAIGTESHLVRRLAAQHPDKQIEILSPADCRCCTMLKINPHNLRDVLKKLIVGEIVNQIIVEEDVRRDANLALQRMLNL